MKSKRFRFLITLIGLTFLVSGCSSVSTSQTNEPKPTPSTSQSIANTAIPQTMAVDNVALGTQELNQAIENDGPYPIAWYSWKSNVASALYLREIVKNEQQQTALLKEIRDSLKKTRK